MIYLSQLLGNPVLDADGEKVGTVSDLGIATGEVFPRITSLAFMGPGRTPIMISWRKFVDTYDEHEVHLKVIATDLRFSYLQPDEVLLARDILNKQIVDTHGMRVVRVNDLKLSDTSSTQLRLLGAEVGARGLLRSLHPALERVALRLARTFGHPMPEKIIAWSYMDLVERDLSNVKLSVSHKTLDDMHPADIADIIERLDPRLRGQVFAQLDDEQRAGAMAEFDDDAMAAELMGNLTETDASRMLSEMDPDDAAELVSELDYDKAEKLLRLMGVQEQRAIRQLLGYRENTAGRIMTSEVASIGEDATVADAVELLRGLDEDFESVRYVYLTDEDGKLSGVVTLNALIERAKGADGLIFGTPVYYAHPSGRVLSVLDRAFYAGKSAFAGKPGACVVSARRGGTAASFDVLNKYFGISSMPVVSSTYWNMVYGSTPEEVRRDGEGMQTLRNLARNMAYLLKCIRAGREAGILPPVQESGERTNFIR